MPIAFSENVAGAQAEIAEIMNFQRKGQGAW